MSALLLELPSGSRQEFLSTDWHFLFFCQLSRFWRKCRIISLSSKSSGWRLYPLQLTTMLPYSHGGACSVYACQTSSINTPDHLRFFFCPLGMKVCFCYHLLDLLSRTHRVAASARHTEMWVTFNCNKMKKKSPYTIMLYQRLLKQYLLNMNISSLFKMCMI